ncbi:bacitracin resistance protein [Agromyces intestinalis]|uniref:Bacitracin resistance protein n=1 Tax=Agromyces intestinalis TaxID=2592652 RepID=A0A5C1YHK8_9MICO|nr:bacitracin resistance protein [Agromyces intestinalis]QEO15674.1 bacitracin resistance protein [Agromyces intestinalis]
MSTAAETTAPAREPMPLWLQVALAIVFGLFYAYDVWEVVQSTLVLTVGLGISLTALGWTILAVAAVAPIALFVGAFVISRRRGILIAVLAYAAGLSASAAVFLSLTALLQATPSLA